MDETFRRSRASFERNVGRIERAGRSTLARMTTRRRCTECRRRFVAAATAGKSQRVCSPQCRKTRRCKLGRRRRRKDAQARADERVRQQKSRAHRCAERRKAKCHAPPSVRKSPKLMGQIRQIMDETLQQTFRQSRATFERRLRRIERKIGSISDRQGVGNGR